jgi:hypothetical protein
MMMGSNEISGLVDGLISTPSTPTLFERIATPSTSNLEVEST